MWEGHTQLEALHLHQHSSGAVVLNLLWSLQPWGLLLGGSGRWRYGCLQCACIEERQCWGNSAQGHLTAICPLFPAFVSLCFSNLREFLFSKSCRCLSGWMFCLQSTSSTSKNIFFPSLFLTYEESQITDLLIDWYFASVEKVDTDTQ